MSEHAINLSSGLPTTVLPESEPALRHLLQQVARADDPRAAAAAAASSFPTASEAWSALGDAGRDTIERYAAYRVGYHRGLDALRANGWRGSGYVRWAAPSNHGFLRCLYGLHLMAAAIGEDGEVDRCAQFLQQLDPSGVPDEIVGSVPAG